MVLMVLQVLMVLRSLKVMRIFQCSDGSDGSQDSEGSGDFQGSEDSQGSEDLQGPEDTEGNNPKRCSDTWSFLPCSGTSDRFETPALLTHGSDDAVGLSIYNSIISRGKCSMNHQALCTAISVNPSPNSVVLSFPEREAFHHALHYS